MSMSALVMLSGHAQLSKNAERALKHPSLSFLATLVTV
jgi:hypothetical protein